MFRDSKLPKEYGRLLCFDTGHAFLHQLTAALRLTSEMLASDEHRLPRVSGLDAKVEEVTAA